MEILVGQLFCRR